MRAQCNLPKPCWRNTEPLDTALERELVNGISLRSSRANSNNNNNKKAADTELQNVNVDSLSDDLGISDWGTLKATL